MKEAEAIRRFLAETLLFSGTDVPLSDGASLLEERVVDSTGVLEVILFVEQQFQIQVLDDEVIPENFDSVSRLVDYMKRKQQVAPEGESGDRRQEQPAWN